ncbi:SMODS-associated NUDIX domain-containing protein [Amycolatopsis kentuckyensis]|uniref:SMODS-associated NUDIX domain-containing protein n=1 Tax=Amycolatopsis kentuckyensis TaxID=218823 RepID=UPI0035695634
MGVAAGFTKRRHPVRVSFSALLRIADDDRYVLFDSPKRPGSYGPPGGVVKIHPPAARLLETWEFRPERTATGAEKMKADLRGFLPGGALRLFQAWFATGAYRETAAECLRRELREELAEVGLEAAEPLTRSVAFTPVRTVREGPDQVPGKPYLQVRGFEVYDLALLNPDAVRLRGELLEAGHDERRTGVICASFDDIVHGRLGPALIAPHSAFLAGPARLAADLPPVR